MPRVVLDVCFGPELECANPSAQVRLALAIRALPLVKPRRRLRFFPRSRLRRSPVLRQRLLALATSLRLHGEHLRLALLRLRRLEELPFLPPQPQGLALRLDLLALTRVLDERVFPSRHRLVESRLHLLLQRLNLATPRLLVLGPHRPLPLRKLPLVPPFELVRLQHLRLLRLFLLVQRILAQDSRRVEPNLRLFRRAPFADFAIFALPRTPRIPPRPARARSFHPGPLLVKRRHRPSPEPVTPRREKVFHSFVLNLRSHLVQVRRSLHRGELERHPVRLLQLLPRPRRVYFLRPSNLPLLGGELADFPQRLVRRGHGFGLGFFRGLIPRGKGFGLGRVELERLRDGHAVESRALTSVPQLVFDGVRRHPRLVSLASPVAQLGKVHLVLVSSDEVVRLVPPRQQRRQHVVDPRRVVYLQPLVPHQVVQHALVERELHQRKHLLLRVGAQQSRELIPPELVQAKEEEVRVDGVEVSVAA